MSQSWAWCPRCGDQGVSPTVRQILLRIGQISRSIKQASGVNRLPSNRVSQSTKQPGSVPDSGSDSATPLTARSLLAATAVLVERGQAAAIWIDNHRPDIRAFGRDVKKRGGLDDPWRYLFTKVSGNTALTMKAALELERRVTRIGRGDTLTLLLGGAISDPELLQELQTEVARAPISVVRRDQLGEALAHIGAGRHHLAVPLLINPIEGIFWTAAADAGLIKQDRHGKWHCTAATSTPGKPVHGLEQVLVLPEVDLEDAFRAFLKAVVYGGAGDPFRHGTATSGWQLRASFLTIALMGWLETLNGFSVDTALCSAFARARLATESRV